MPSLATGADGKFGRPPINISSRFILTGTILAFLRGGSTAADPKGNAVLGAVETGFNRLGSFDPVETGLIRRGSFPAPLDVFVDGWSTTPATVDITEKQTIK